MGELEKTEARLANELKNMINVADEEKENLDAVHDKLDRQRKVDAKNEVSLRERGGLGRKWRSYDNDWCVSLLKSVFNYHLSRKLWLIT